MNRTGARRASHRDAGAPVTNRRRYLVVVLLLLLDDDPVAPGVVEELAPLELGLGLVDVVLSVVVVVVVDDDDGVVVDGAVLGEAAGVVRSRSVTFSVRVSVQAVRPSPSATAKTAVSILFMSMPPCGGCATVCKSCNGHAATSWLDRPDDNHYQCGSDRGSKGDSR